ncbi:hypothetical protein CJF32_00008276 [Rutstroemia sp. NJR-2017a WRK4]|nr:hypothetical protein CJF32_00008276 [Rutstroemia sp. NJR-2017a WRK4]
MYHIKILLAVASRTSSYLSNSTSLYTIKRLSNPTQTLSRHGSHYFQAKEDSSGTQLSLLNVQTLQFSTSYTVSTRSG